MRGFLDRDPCQFDELGVRSHHTLDFMRYRRGIGGQEARIEAARAPWRCYGARDEVNLAEVGMHVCLGELGPDLSGRFRRTITLDAKQQPGLLGRLAYRAEGKRAGKIRTRFG